MKYLAYLTNDSCSEIVSIYDVIQGLHSPNSQEWENRTYFSLWHHVPMIAKVKQDKQHPHFAFKPGFGKNGHSGGGESIEHQLAKKVIYDLKALNIKIGDIEDTLEFSHIIIEQPFANGQYRADLYVTIKNETKFKFPVGSKLALELHYKNKVNRNKQKFYRHNNIAALEIDIWNEIKYDHDVKTLQNQLIGYFKKTRFARRIHDPHWKKNQYPFRQQKRTWVRKFIDLLARLFRLS